MTVEIGCGAMKCYVYEPIWTIYFPSVHTYKGCFSVLIILILFIELDVSQWTETTLQLTMAHCNVVNKVDGYFT